MTERLPQLEPAIKEAVEQVCEGWYSEGRIDWEDFLDRVENLSDVDLGCDTTSPLIRAIKNYARKVRRESE